MHWPLFSYSREMQIILFLFSSIFGFIYAWFSTKLILLIYCENVKTSRIVIFSFITGVILYVWLFYIFYLLQGLQLLPWTNILIGFPNPISTLIWWVLSLKILKLSTRRSITLMRNFYIYTLITMSLMKFVNRTFFIQNTYQYNYLLDMFKVLSEIIIVIAIYKFLKNV